MILLACFLSLLGLTLLSLTKKRHRKDLIPKYKLLPKKIIYGLLVVGFLLLFASALIFVTSRGLGLGLVYAFGWLSVSGLALSVLLSGRLR